jgi:hypothetical protein
MRGLLFLAAALPSLLVGCATEAIEDADDEAEARPLEAWVVLERVDADGQVRTNVSAKFVQLSEGDRALAFKLVGVRPAIPAAGECVSLASLEELEMLPIDDATPGGSSMAADLVDAGDVTLSVRSDEGSREIKLSPRAFPDVADLVSGVFYTSPDAEIALPPAARYALGATGSGVVDAFSVEVDAPRSPVINSVSDVTVGSDIQMTWDAGAADGTVYVDFRGATTHRCTFADKGEAVLPREMLSVADRGEATLTLHRLVERALPIESGEPNEDVREATVLFDFARSVRVVVR